MSKTNGRLARIAASIIGSLLTLGLIAPTQALDGLMLTDADMRVGPGESFPIVGTAPEKADVRINGCIESDGWCVVRHDGRHGWVPFASVRQTGITRSTNQLPEPLIIFDASYGYHSALIGAGAPRTYRYGRTGRTYRGGGYNRSRASYRNRRYRSRIGGARGPRPRPRR